MQFRKDSMARVMAMLLALVICLGLFPWPAFAEGIEADADKNGVDVATVEKKNGHLGVLMKKAADAADIGVPTVTADWDAETKLMAKELLGRMSDNAKIGQLFLLHWPGDGAGSKEKAEEFIKQYAPGGFIVFGDMFKGAIKTDVIKKIEFAQDASKNQSGIPLMISVDEEGGNVCRISGNASFRSEKFKSPQYLKDNGGIPAVTAQYSEMAGLLTDLGINMNHAPVADTSNSGGFIYGRTWGGDYNENTEYVKAAVEALESNGIGATLKHFPGYGNSADDTHHGFAFDYRDEATFNQYLVPFKAGIDAGCQAVMVTHNIISYLDETETTPVSLLPATYELLRRDMGFNGLAITDDLGMEAITKFNGSQSPAVLALQAGADMVITSLYNKEGKFIEDNDVMKVRAAVNNGTLPMERINDACFRVLCWKIEHDLIEKTELGNEEAMYTPAGSPIPEARGSFTNMWNKTQANGGTVTLLKNIDLRGKTYTINGQNVTLDLNGKTISIRNVASEAIYYNDDIPRTQYYLFKVIGGGSLTVKDGNNKLNEEVTQVDEPGQAGYDGQKITYFTPADDDPSRANKHVVDLQSAGAIEMTDNVTVGSRDVSSIFCVFSGNLTLDGGRYVNRIKNASIVFARKTGTETWPKITINDGALVGSGRGLQVTWTKVYMNGGYIAGNAVDVNGKRNDRAVAAGAGIFLEHSRLYMTGGVVAGNKVKPLGGGESYKQNYGGAGIFQWHSLELKISGGVISGNETDGLGGALVVNRDSQTDTDTGTHANGLTISGGMICFNEAKLGGGIFLAGGKMYGTYSYPGCGYARLTGGSIIGNKAKDSGGGIYVSEDLNANGVPGTRLFVSGSVVIDGNKLENGKANNVDLQKNAKITIDGSLSEEARIGITGIKDQVVAEPATNEYMNYFYSDDKSLSCLKVGDQIKLVAPDEYVKLTLRQGKTDGDITSGDIIDEVFVPKGTPLSSIDLKMVYGGTTIPLNNSKFYKDADRKELFTDRSLYSDTELYLSLFTMSFIWDGEGRKDVTAPEGRPLDSDALEVNGTDISGLSFTDEGSATVTFKSLKENGLDRDYVFYNVVINDNGSSKSEWVLADCKYSIDLDMKPAFRLNVSGISEDKISRVYADEGKTKERITLEHIDGPVLISRDPTREINRATYALSAIVDGKMRTLADLNNLYGPALFDGSEYRYMLVNEEAGADIISALEPFGFKLKEYNGGLVFANTDSDNRSYIEAYATVRPDDDPAGGWRIPFAFSNTSSSFDRCRMYYLSRPLDGVSDEVVSMLDLTSRGFWTVSVKDYVRENEPDDASFEKYVPHGGAFSFDLPVREGQEWLVRDGYDAKVVLDKESRPGYVHVEISDIMSRVIIYCGESDTLRYSVQYCAYTDEIDWNAEGGVMKLDMIDTGRAELPTNKMTPTDSAVKSFWIDKEGNVMTKADTLKPIYKQRDFEYVEAPTLLHCDRLYMDTHYRLDEVWIYKGTDRDKDLENMEPDSDIWTIITKDDVGGKDLRDLHLTSDPDFAKEYPNDTLLIENEAIIRFVYNTTNGKEGDNSGYDSGGKEGDNNGYDSVDVTFYDYDITDGNLYSKSGKKYVKTSEYKINSSATVGSGTSRFAFGNANSGVNTGLSGAKLSDGKYFNQGNGDSTIAGCAFGLVQSWLDADGNIQYNPEIKGPDLFGTSSTNGKTVIYGDGKADYALGFSRVGDNYTLASVQKKTGEHESETVKGIGYDFDGDLTRFQEVYQKTSEDNGMGQIVKQIYSNSFWPMDHVYDGGAYGGESGHDPKFGKSKIYNNNLEDLPQSDDSHGPGWQKTWKGYCMSPVYEKSVDHNSYFGMSFELEFNLQPDYIGTLDYCFFGDDDMWVFLDGEQILDIGGVHSSVGEYVNLWNYIKDKDGNLIKDKKNHSEVTEHKLSFFYLERGASGSTCWMRFTIPEARFEEGGQFKPAEFNNLQLTKIADGVNLDGSETFAFGISLEDGDGNSLRDDFTCVLRQPGEQDLTGLLTPYGFVFGEETSPSVELKSGGALEILKVPVGSRYEITENVDTKWNVVFSGDGVSQTDTKAFGSILADSGADIICTNTYAETMELPKTGGGGTQGIMAAGAVLLVLSSSAALMAMAATRVDPGKRRRRA